MYEEEMARAKTSIEYFEADFRYHKVFFDYCGNRFMKETYKQYNFIRTLLIRFAIRTEEERIGHQTTQEDHPGLSVRGL
ncbi:MAG: FCD domain-containing protein [Enterocloster sp.]